MITPDDFCLWSNLDEVKRKPIIDEVILERYLTQQGYRCMYDDSNQGDIHMVRITDKRIKKTGTNAMYRYLVAVLTKSHEEWLQPLKAYRVFLFAPTIIQMERIEPFLLKDTATTSYIPFDNGIVSVDCAGAILNTYSDVLTGDTCILDDKIIHRNVILAVTDDYKNGAWYKFCENAVGEKGVPYLMRAIGYLLHTYKDTSNAKMIVFADSDNPDNPNANGGTGKSLIAFNALKEIRSMYWEDGKGFNPKSTFKFQGMSSENDIACIDDIPKGFNQEVLYNMITGNFAYEEKYKPRKTIDFKYSVKIVVTGNFGFVLGGDSDKRRTCMIGFTDHYNKDNTPIKEFKHRFFDDWTGKRAIEYQYFYNFMFDCIRRYLLEGIEDYRYDDIIQKGTIHSNIDKNSDLLNAVHAAKYNFIGIEMAKQMNCWRDFVSNKDDKVVMVINQVMESEGYKLKNIRRHIRGNDNAVKLYYFEK